MCSLKEKILILFFGVIGLLLASGSIIYLIYLLDFGELFSDFVSIAGFFISCVLAVIGLHLFMVAFSSSKT